MEEVDVLVIGTGIAGGVIGNCLASAGVKTLAVEAKHHPRFAIGESTVPATTHGFSEIGRQFNVPEIVSLSNYIKASELGVTSYPKCHFWFGWHGAGKEMDEGQEMVFETFRPPIGPDSHLLRSELDAKLVSLFPKYGCSYLDDTVVRTLDNDHPDGVLVDLETIKAGGDPVKRKVLAKFVIDASGHSAFVSKLMGTLQKDPKTLTRNRVIYGHFKSPPGWSLDELMGGPHSAFRYRREAGTMHHCFEGGWVWVIPFVDDTVSVGIVLNVDTHPLDTSISAKEEWRRLLERYPTMNAHLGQLEPTRVLLRRGRHQLLSDATYGRRYALTPHASAFIDPLFSSGMLLTSRWILRALPLVVRAVKTNNYDMAPWRAVEDALFKEFAQVDRMVAGTVESFKDFEVFKQYWRMWIDSTIRHTNDAMLHGRSELPLYGSHDAAWVATCEEAYAIVTDRSLSHEAAAKKLKKVFDGNNVQKGIPFYPSYEIGDGRAVNCPAMIWTPHDAKVFYKRSPYWLLRACLAFAAFMVMYAVSFVTRSDLHRSLGDVYSMKASAYRKSKPFRAKGCSLALKNR